MAKLNKIDIKGKSYAWGVDSDESAFNKVFLTIWDSSKTKIYHDWTNGDVGEFRNMNGNSTVSESTVRRIILSTLKEREIRNEPHKLAFAINRLERIADPIKWMQHDAKETGCEVDGHWAVQLSSDPEYLRKIAVDALRTLDDM